MSLALNKKIERSKRSPVSRAPCYRQGMTKKRTTRQTPTHFDQVPLSAVRRITQDNVAQALRRKGGVAVEPAHRQADPASNFHAVQFYESPDALCRIVGSFIGEGLEQGAAGILIATPDHAKRIEACLRQCDFDVDALTRAGALVIVDARDTLNEFMGDAMPNPGAFRRAVGGHLTGIRRSSGGRPIRAYGEMVDLLWKDGREAAAIRLETLWNQLARSLDFELLCGYSMGNFYKGSSLDEVTRQHTHVVPTDGGAAVPTLVRPAGAQA